MKLYPKDYIEPTPVLKPIFDKVACRVAIEAMVTEPMEYKEIIESIQRTFHNVNKHFNDSLILEVIREIDADWNPATDPKEL